MSANSFPPDNPKRISVTCECGKKTVANSTRSGKRLKCSSCGQIVVIPARAALERHSETGNRRLMIVFWSLLVVGVVGLRRGRTKAKRRKKSIAATGK